jgi:hypothetical protein
LEFGIYLTQFQDQVMLEIWDFKYLGFFFEQTGRFSGQRLRRTFNPN